MPEMLSVSVFVDGKEERIYGMELTQACMIPLVGEEFSLQIVDHDYEPVKIEDKGRLKVLGREFSYTKNVAWGGFPFVHTQVMLYCEKVEEDK